MFAFKTLYTQPGVYKAIDEIHYKQQAKPFKPAEGDVRMNERISV